MFQHYLYGGHSGVFIISVSQLPMVVIVVVFIISVSQLSAKASREVANCELSSSLVQDIIAEQTLGKDGEVPIPNNKSLFIYSELLQRLW